MSSVPELGLNAPGLTIRLRDSHTITHGAFGPWRSASALSEVEHVGPLRPSGKVRVPVVR